MIVVLSAKRFRKRYDKLTVEELHMTLTGAPVSVIGKMSLATIFIDIGTI